MTDLPAHPLVIVPTFNESGNVERIVQRVRAAVPHAHVLVADDNSPDGTGEMADKLADADPAVHVLHRPGKEGLGAAYLAGFRWALERDYDAVVEMDADGSHQPEQLPALLAQLRAADVVLGSRWVPGGRVLNWPRRRELLCRGGNTIASLAYLSPLHDATVGYRVFRRRPLELLDLSGVGSQGYCFQVDLASRAVRHGLRVT